MRYEVRVGGESIGVFAEAEDALDCVRRALAENPDQVPEIIDMETGNTYDPDRPTEENSPGAAA